MNVYLYDEAKVSAYEDDIRALLRVCMDHNFVGVIPTTFYDEKLASLKHYLREGQAYFFAAQEGNRLMGILWGCVMNTVTGLKFHVLYFAVCPEAQGTGVGAELLRAAEEKTAELGIPKVELMVSSDNVQAVRFYEKFAYEPIRLVMEKTI